MPGQPRACNDKGSSKGRAEVNEPPVMRPPPIRWPNQTLEAFQQLLPYINAIEEGNIKEGGDADEDERPVTVEMCCGCARLSYELNKEGFETVAVDWKGKKDKTEIYCR